VIGLAEERRRIVPLEGCGFISEEETSLGEALFDSGESMVRVDAFSMAEADEGVAVPFFALPMVLASLSLGFVRREAMVDRRRRLSKKDGLPAIVVSQEDAGLREKRTTQFNAFPKAIVADAQVRSEHRGRRAAVSDADRGGTVVLASARGILGGPGTAKGKNKAKGRETCNTKTGRLRIETKVGARADVDVPRAIGGS
jgi:hypothetical protein